MRILAIAGAVLSLCWTLTAHAQPIPDLTIEELEKRIEEGELGKIRALALEVGGQALYRKRFGKGELGERVDI